MPDQRTDSASRTTGDSRPDLIGIAESVRSGDAKAVDVLESALAAIAAGNEALNAFVQLDEEGARASAEAVDATVARGEDPGPLAGVPLGVKELEECAGLRHTRGSLLHRDIAPSERDSIQIARMRAAGAIPVGMTAASEYGMDSVTSTRLWGTTRNPWDLELTPGGSSGGSAAAVCAGLVPLATGTDAGGSIRQPAAFCGLAGFKPTYGLIPRREIDASAVETAGVLTTTVLATARALDVVAGDHPLDRTSLRPPNAGFEVACRDAMPGRLSLAWSDLGYFAETEVTQVARAAAERLAAILGVELEERQVTLPSPFPIWVEPVALELRGRFEAEGVWPERTGELCDMTRELLEMAPDPTAAGLAEAARRRTLFEHVIAEAFAGIDILLTPTNCIQPFAAAGPWPTEVEGRNVELQTTDAYEMLANLTGRPALSVPAGLSSRGLPIGLQLMGRRNDDSRLLAAGHLYDRENPVGMPPVGWLDQRSDVVAG